jgi:hypothetical protein
VKSEEMINEAAAAISALKDAHELVEGVFSPLDKALETLDEPMKKKFLELLDAAEEKVRQMGGEKQDWWLSEIYLRKARCAKEILEKPKEHHDWKRAYEFGVKSNNHEVSVQSSFELGFSFVQFTTSIRDILEIQMNCVKAICNEGSAIHSRLSIIGINLFDFWRQLEYRRLSESDLKAKQYVLDGAKSLQEAGFDDHKAAPLMILLVSKVFDFDDPCIEWAKLEAGILDIPIPEDVKAKIESYFEFSGR